MSWCGFIWIYLCGFILFEVCLPSWLCGFMPVAKFKEVFRHYFKYFFSLTLFLLSWNSDGRNVISFVTVPWVPETVHFFFSLFSLCSFWIISILFLSSLILSFLSSILLLSPSIIFISVIVFFSPKISFWFFFYFLFIYETLFLCWDFLSFHLLQACSSLIHEAFSQ